MQVTAPSEAQISSMYRRDLCTAILFVVILWLTFTVVVALMTDDIKSGLLMFVVAFLGFAVCTLNTLSMVATMRHLREQGDKLYRQELYWLTQTRADRARSPREGRKLKDYYHGKRETREF